MINEKLEKENKILQQIGLELMFITPNKWDCNQGITAIELSKKLGLKLDVVKKNLKVLQEKKIVRSIGINPKCWQFDEYNFQRMDEDDPIYKLLCNFEDIDFDKFFDFMEVKKEQRKYRF